MRCFLAATSLAALATLETQARAEVTEGHVQFVRGPRVHDAATSGTHRGNLFVFTTSDGGRWARLVTGTVDARAWADLHEAAFRSVGGAPRMIFLGGVQRDLVPDRVLYPVHNPQLRAVLARAQVQTVVFDATAETPVPGMTPAQSLSTALTRLEFGSLRHARSYLAAWQTTRRTPAVLRATSFAQIAPLADLRGHVRPF